MPVIATWNVNSINARMPVLGAWLRRVVPDVVLLQETKCTDDAFPHLEIEALGYKVEAHGQKSYNGVAILARIGIEAVRRGLPGDDADAQARYIEGVVGGLRVASIYLPNGNPPGTDRFAYKLAWMRRLGAHAATLLEDGVPTVLGGDYNVIPEPIDVRDPARWTDDALFRPESRRAWRGLCHLGLTDAFRALHPGEQAFSFWDYQHGAWQSDDGVRIDHLLLTPAAADRLRRVWIDKDPRAQPRASDHTPVLVELAEPG